MKTAIYIEDGVVQLVITPESEFEKNAIKAFDGEGVTANIHNGSFYDCRGGWVRQKEVYPHLHGISRDADKSLIIVNKPSTTKEQTP